ncbi:MAG TPA: metal ABC transporter permease [Thermodesulfovibrionales bacterium]|nr:metal ABC transporter permease [Thermodesulfovibrionales bacterium]
MEIVDFLHYAFIRRALITGSFIALVCSLLGVLLVLRRFSLIGDGLAHVTFGSVAIGLLLKQHPVYVSIPIVMLSSLGILKLTEKAKLYGDAAIGIVSSIGIAGGILIASIAGGFNVDLFSYLFGNILSISKAEVFTAIVLSLVVLLIISLFYKEHFSTTFDEEFAKVSGINTKKINSILVLLTGITVVLAMRVVGIMLTSALLILPAVTALQIAKSFKNTMAISSVIAMSSVIIGIYISFVMNLPTGATIVMTNFIFFIAAFLYRNIFPKD